MPIQGTAGHVGICTLCAGSQRCTASHLGGSTQIQGRELSARGALVSSARARLIEGIEEGRQSLLTITTPAFSVDIPRPERDEPVTRVTVLLLQSRGYLSIASTATHGENAIDRRPRTLGDLPAGTRSPPETWVP
ncbi:hypothetical protein BO71DRAFT_436685 [Aspergillus ellipticus CBS 707.79]|uniref:Uncharacterized protein n=1 Tax=Aspergillus ellipticus CBS 707.79 TaxID=1448320 RepID=A0A319DH60_9EURO|nr:hypothetical protein BO71DRAFT_436685 [Aspergillus ellipticus CBS 707.79]